MATSRIQTAIYTWARAFEDAAIISLCGRGLVVRERGDPDDVRYEAAPYATIAVREVIACRLADKCHEFILSIHVHGVDRNRSEITQLTDAAERAALTVGAHLREYKIVDISLEGRSLGDAKGEWVGCLSIRALLAPKD